MKPSLYIGSAALLCMAWSCSNAKPQGDPKTARAPAEGILVDDAPGSDGQATRTGDPKKTTTTPAAVSKTGSSDAPIPAGPTSDGFKVANGPFTLDLAVPRPALAGAQLTGELIVNASAPGVPASITLQRLAVKAGAGTGLVLYRPVVVAQKTGAAEQMFSIGTNINQRVAKGRLLPLAQETLTISGIEAGETIRLRFSALEPLAEAENAGLANYRDCKAPQNFQAMATALTPCKACHSGLFNYDFIGRDLASACGLNLKLIDISLNPAGSLPNLQRPVTGGHPATTTTGYSQALSTWRSGEGF